MIKQVRQLDVVLVEQSNDEIPALTVVMNDESADKPDQESH